MQPAYQDAVLDEIVPPRRRPLIIKTVRASLTWDGAIVEYIEDILSKSPSQDHHFTRFWILVDEICFGEVTECFMDEHTC